MSLNLKTLSALFLLSLSTPVRAEIRETDSMADALAGAEPGDTVVLDIDNTILETTQTLGSDQWYGHVHAGYRAAGLSEDSAIDRAIADWSAVQKRTSVRAVEPTTPSLIRRLQRAGVRIFALTARPVELKEASLRQLRTLGVRLASDGLRFPPRPDAELAGGVLFVGPRNNKGALLSELFESSRLDPGRILFVDDKLKHVQNMDAVFAAAGFENVNFRYGAADQRVAAFSAALAAVQWDHFTRSGGEILSDEEAGRQRR